MNNAKIQPTPQQKNHPRRPWLVAAIGIVVVVAGTFAWFWFSTSATDLENNYLIRESNWGGDTILLKSGQVVQKSGIQSTNTKHLSAEDLANVKRLLANPVLLTTNITPQKNATVNINGVLTPFECEDSWWEVKVRIGDRIKTFTGDSCTDETPKLITDLTKYLH